MTLNRWQPPWGDVSREVTVCFKPLDSNSQYSLDASGRNGIWWRNPGDSNYNAWQWIPLRSLAPPEEAMTEPPVNVKTKPPVEVKTEPPVEVKTEPTNSEQQWYRDANASAEEEPNWERSPSAEEETEAEPDWIAEGKISPITPDSDGIEDATGEVTLSKEDGKNIDEESKVVESVTRKRPAPDESVTRKRPTLKRRDGPNLWGGEDGPSFAEKGGILPEDRVENYYGYDFEMPSVRQDRIQINRSKAKARTWVKIAVVCKFWYECRCQKENSCTYAHARDELGKYIKFHRRSPLPSSSSKRGKGK